MIAKNISFVIPNYLLDQIEQRAHLAGRKSRNNEMRYLLALALEWLNGVDPKVVIQSGECTRIVVWMDFELQQILQDRVLVSQRSIGKEIVRLLAYAIQESTDRDLEMIKQLMGQRAHVQ